MRAQAGFKPYVATIGTGARKALALHCTMAFSGAWKGFSTCLGDDWTLIAPDMPSHGRSADWDMVSDFSDTVYAASLACLSEPMDVIGHSFGGVTALRLAVEHPDLVRSLTMIEPVFFHAADLTDPAVVADHNSAARAVFDALDEGDRETAARLFNKMWSSDAPRWADVPEQVRGAMMRAISVVPDTHDFLYDDTAKLMARLGTVTIPSLLVRGALSHGIIAATNRTLAHQLPNARDEKIAGAGHMAPITHPKEMARLWSDFVNGPTGS